MSPKGPTVLHVSDYYLSSSSLLPHVGRCVWLPLGRVLIIPWIARPSHERGGEGRGGEGRGEERGGEEGRGGEGRGGEGRGEERRGEERRGVSEREYA